MQDLLINTLLLKKLTKHLRSIAASLVFSIRAPQLNLSVVA